MNISEITIKRTSSYGRYQITGEVNGTEVTAFTTDSEAFDYFHDDDFPEKQDEAINHCKWTLQDAYENQL
jgi:hypothetical protein